MAFSPVVKLCHNGSSELNDPIYRWQTFLLQWIKTSYLQTINLPLPLLMHDTQILNSHLLLPIQSICKLSRLNVMPCNIPTYPTAHLAFPTSIWIPFLGLLASTLLLCCAALLWPSDLSVRAGDAMTEWEDSLLWRRNSSYSSRSGLFRRKVDFFS